MTRDIGLIVLGTFVSLLAALMFGSRFTRERYAIRGSDVIAAGAVSVMLGFIAWLFAVTVSALRGAP